MMFLSIWFGCGLLGIVVYLIKHFRTETLKDLTVSDLFIGFLILLMGVGGLVNVLLLMLLDAYYDKIHKFMNKKLF